MITAIRISDDFTGQMIVENYGNLKTMCEHLGVSYHTYKAKKFPFKIGYKHGNIHVYKTEVKRGEKKEKKKT